MINYYLLTKPGIIMGNLFTVAAGFILGSQGFIDFWLFCATLLGLAIVIASACVFNNYIDREVDQKMVRTRNRPLARGLISGRSAIVFATLLGIIGTTILLVYTNLLTAVIASIGFLIYVCLYSLWKGRTVYGTAIGSIAGAVPPVVGYCAANHQLDAGAVILFGMLILWQMPHFFSIAIYRIKDYAAGAIPVLPIKKGMHRTKVHMVIYIIAFLFSAVLLTTFHYAGYPYLIVAMALGLLWLGLCLKGFKQPNDALWARRMFRMSLILIMGICIVIPLDRFC